MTLHFPESEWHVFEFDEGGHVEIIFFYSQSEEIIFFYSQSEVCSRK